MTNNTVPKWFLYSSITMNIKVTTKITIDLPAEDQIIENWKTESKKIFCIVQLDILTCWFLYIQFLNIHTFNSLIFISAIELPLWYYLLCKQTLPLIFCLAKWAPVSLNRIKWQRPHQFRIINCYSFIPLPGIPPMNWNIYFPSLWHHESTTIRDIW